MKQKKLLFNLNILYIILLIAAAVTMLLAAMSIHKVDACIKKQADIEENRRQCELQTQALADASDYLTNEVWHFIATLDTEHMDNYWNEIYKEKSREKAMEALTALSLTPEEEALIRAGKEESDRLVQGEAWAMRLASEALGFPEEALPKDVAEVRLSSQEEALSPDRKRELALNYLFGDSYTSSKTDISSYLSDFRSKLRERKNRELQEAALQTKTALRSSQLCSAVMLLYLLLAGALFHLLAMRPFRSYYLILQHLDGKNFTPLIPSGSVEIREFANVFNRIYSDWETQRQQLEAESLRFHVAVENSHMVVYEYLPDSDTYTSYGTLNISGFCGVGKGNGPERTIHCFLQGFAEKIMTRPNLDILKKLVETGGGTAQLQIISDQGVPTWVSVTATAIYGDNNTTAKLIGKITNIQSEKEKEFELDQERSRDGLTGLYRKGTGLRKIQQYLGQGMLEKICTLMILDMDDFGRVNELEGSIFADAILQDVADILRAETGPEDILVRLGGDEFVLLLKDCPRTRAVQAGSRIAGAVRGLTPEGSEIPVSVSIGMCTTEVIEEYSGLYRCAESSLKYVKDHGKGEAVCYLDTSNELGTVLTQVYTEGHPINKIDRSDNCCEDIISFSLDLLGKSKNLTDAIMLLLAKVGRQYGLERVSIMEFDPEYLSCRFIYQWSAHPSDNKMDATYYITQEEMTQITEAYDDDGLCSRYIIGRQSVLNSILHTPIWDNGSIGGAMSFERSEAGYCWTPEERQLLSELGKIIASFLLKARADSVSQAKTDFLSRMSHEIRTPMNAITGMTAIAKTALDDPKRALDCLNKIESANAYLLSLINDILDMSRIESGKLELSLSALDIRSQLQELGDLMKPQAAEKHLDLRIEDNFTGPVRVMADELHLNQIFVNLLGNAIKFTPADGTVILCAEQEASDDKNVLLRFSVSDTGIGIPADAQEKIFNAFEQACASTVSAYGGTGLGLSISSRLVQMMGGALTVQSAPGKGSVFSFSLRFENAPSEDAVKPAASAAPVDYDPHGKRILLVEDNALNREIAEEILSMNGFIVETADNGLKAVESFNENRPGWYDAILMDIRMPVMDGMEAARRIRTMNKPDSRHIPIIAMTANAFDEDMKKSLENGMNGHLSKPIEVEKLLEMLRQCITAAKA